MHQKLQKSKQNLTRSKHQKFVFYLLQYISFIDTDTVVQETHVDDPVFGVVGVGATDVEAVLGHGLYDSDVVTAVEVLWEEELGEANVS